MKVKLDEDLGQLHAELLRGAGHVAQRVTKQGLSGAKDPAVWVWRLIEGKLREIRGIWRS